MPNPLAALTIGSPKKKWEKSCSFYEMHVISFTRQSPSPWEWDLGRGRMCKMFQTII